MNSEIKFTIVTPVYNREKVIGRSITSVLKQSFKEFEVIVIDDGSSDNTLKIVESYESDMRLRILVNDCNRGVNYSRNRGISAATGEYIIFLDSDDNFFEEALVEVYNCISKYDGYNHYLFSVDYREEAEQSLVMRESYSYEDWLKGDINGDYVHVVKCEVLKAYPFFEEFRAAEVLNWLRIYKKAGSQRLFNTPIICVDRTGCDSLSKSGTLVSTKIIEEQLSVRLKYLEMYGEDLGNVSPGIYAQYLRKTILLAVCCMDYEVSKELISKQGNKYFKFAFLLINNIAATKVIKTLVIAKSKLKNM